MTFDSGLSTIDICNGNTVIASLCHNTGGFHDIGETSRYAIVVLSWTLAIRSDAAVCACP